MKPIITIILFFAAMLEWYELYVTYFGHGLDEAERRFHQSNVFGGDAHPREAYVTHLRITWFLAFMLTGCFIYSFLKYIV